MSEEEKNNKKKRKKKKEKKGCVCAWVAMQPANKSARPESEEPAPVSSTPPPTTSSTDTSTRQPVRGNEPKLTPAQQREREKAEAARLKEADGRCEEFQTRGSASARRQKKKNDGLNLSRLARISPSSVTYAGFGVLGTQGVMRVSTGEVVELLRKKGIKVDPETVRWLLDAGINGAQPEWLNAIGRKGDRAVLCAC